MPQHSQKQAQHTPGPWRAFPDQNGYSDQLNIADEKGRFVAMTPGGLDDGEDASNARLIAAAPDYDAAVCKLLRAVDMPEDGGNDADGLPATLDNIEAIHEAIRDLRAARRRALGTE